LGFLALLVEILQQFFPLADLKLVTGPAVILDLPLCHSHLVAAQHHLKVVPVQVEQK
jgi:hypothetical protein